MVPWVLVIWFLAGGTTTVTGFSSRESCEKAGRLIVDSAETQAFLGGIPRARFTCFQVL